MPSVEVSLLIPARNADQALKETVEAARAYCARVFPDQFEIILIPNPHPDPARSKNDHSQTVADELARRFSEVRVVPHSLPPGKGAALRTGFKAAQGQKIFFTDSDLPYDLNFFEQASLRLDQGFHFVTGNRRLPESQFNVPVEHLPLAYKRHRLGLGFNRVARLLLPRIKTTDTQAGIKALSRTLAEKAFGKMTCPGFFFDLELFLTAQAEGLAQTELPVTLYLNTEKSTIRVFRESLSAAYWLTRITFQNVAGYYGNNPTPRPSLKQVLARYRHASLGTKFFLTLRYWLTPYTEMSRELPPVGTVWDLGSGHGLFSLLLAEQARGRQVLGFDHDDDRIALAKKASVAAQKGALPELPGSSAPQGVALIDVMHYFDESTQEEILSGVFSKLSAGGICIVREVDPNGGMIAKWNRWYEKLATRSGFTQSAKNQLYFRTPDQWKNALEEAGFQVRYRPCTHFLFSDVLFVGSKW